MRPGSSGPSRPDPAGNGLRQDSGEINISPRLFPRLARTDSTSSAPGGGSAMSKIRTQSSASGTGTGGGEAGFSSLAEYLTKKFDIRRTESDAAGSELSFGSAMSKGSSFTADAFNPSAGSGGLRGGKSHGLASTLYSRKLEGIEELLRQTKQQCDTDLEQFTNDCREALGGPEVSEAEQFVYASLMEIAESVQALSLDDLRSSVQDALQMNAGELQVLRHKSHGIDWAKKAPGGQSPVTKLQLIVAKLSRVAEQFRPSAASPLSSMIQAPVEDRADDSTKDSLAAVPMKIYGMDVGMLTSKSPSPSLEALREEGSDNEFEVDRGLNDEAASRASSQAMGESPKFAPIQGGGWNLPSQLLMLLPRTLRGTVATDVGPDPADAFVPIIPSLPGQELLERWRARRQLNLREDLVLCRICEQNQKLSIFEKHTRFCALVANYTQKIVEINIKLLRYAVKIEKRADENHKSGAKRSATQKGQLLRLAEICRVPQDNTLTEAHVRLGRALKNRQNATFALPGGLLCAEKIAAIIRELDSIPCRPGSLVHGIAGNVKDELEALSKTFTALVNASMEFVKDGSDSKEDVGLSAEDLNSPGTPIQKAISLASNLQNSTILWSIESGRDSSLPGIHDFEILKPISRGAFGRVFLARKKTTGDIFAIKALQKKDMLRKNLVARVRTEKDIMAGVANPFIVRFFWSFQSRSKLFLVMEYLPGGDMYSLLCNLGFLDASVARQYLAEIVLALEYLHSMNIVHRDIKPDNVLIGRDGHIKLTDFGLSRLGLLGNNIWKEDDEEPEAEDKLSTGRNFQRNALRRVGSWGSFERTHKNEVNEMVGTPDYLAPELLLGQPHSFQVDWWAVGVVMYEFSMGIPPFHDSTAENIFENILNGAIEWPVVPDEISAEGLDLLQRLLDPNPATRIGAKSTLEIKEHPFFRGVDWDSVLDEKATFIPEYASFDDTSYFNQRNTNSALSVDYDDLHIAKSGNVTGKSNMTEQSIGDGGAGEAGPRVNSAPDGEKFDHFAFQNLKNLEARNFEVLMERRPEL